jgi:hypothetical protein
MPDLALVCMGCVFTGLVGQLLFEEEGLIVCGGGGGLVVSGKDIGGVTVRIVLESGSECIFWRL